MFLVPSSINVSIFHITWLGTFWIDLINTVPILNEETKAKKINMWLIICSQDESPGLIPKPMYFLLYPPTVEVKCTVSTA